MDSGSVTQWIEQIKKGGTIAAEQELWERYFSRLAALARKTLDDLPPHVRDDEDVALSAMNSFFIRAKHGGFPQVLDRTDLWQLLAKITVRKSIDRRRHVGAQKRRCGQLLGESDFAGSLREMAVHEPSPDMLAAVNEECERLMGVLDEDLQTVARMKLEGYSNAEIAEKIGRVERTVERKLQCIRQFWLNAVDVK